MKVKSEYQLALFNRTWIQIIFLQPLVVFCEEMYALMVKKTQNLGL